MRDDSLNIHTHDFNYNCIDKEELPGQYAGDCSPVDPMAKIAHQHTQTVVKFMNDVLRIKYIDSTRVPRFTSTVKCIKGNNQSNEWRNACWIPRLNQVIYGQQLIDERLTSYAEKLEIVAHEFFHGITQYTARLDSKNEPGALNESYSDIFAVLIINYREPDFGKWNWEIGRPFGETNKAIRNIAEPWLHGHPEQMIDYLRTDKDKGGIHTNCSIHNKAAYNLIVSQNEREEYIFDVETIANLFYLTLKTKLTPNSSFSDSKQGLLTTATTIYRGNKSKLTEVAKAIKDAFTSVGIS